MKYIKIAKPGNNSALFENEKGEEIWKAVEPKVKFYLSKRYKGGEEVILEENAEIVTKVLSPEQKTNFVETNVAVTSSLSKSGNSYSNTSFISSDNRNTSIERQACFKAACNAVVSLTGQIDRNDIVEIIATIAKRGLEFIKSGE